MKNSQKKQSRVTNGSYVEHAQLGLAGLLLAGTCARRLAMVLPGFSIDLPATRQAFIAVARLFARRHI